ncbi:MAG: Spy/CpxP family protein refolding chaperone [Gemmatimonadaceae bacterium]
MKRVYIAILALAFLGGAATTVSAQSDQASQQGGQAGGRARMMDQLLKGIDLSSAQKASVDSIQTNYRSQMPAFTPGSPPDANARAQRRELMQKETADIRNVLTPDQQKTFDKNLEDMRSRMGKRGQ